MYTVVLALHSLVRWALVLSALGAAATSLLSWLGGVEWPRGVRTAGVALVASADTQVLLGLLLYFFFSPFAPAALSHPQAAFSEPGFRYWFFLHPAPAIGVAVLAHLGSAFARRGGDAANRRTVACLYGAALLLLALAIPWPFEPFGRPLWPF